MLNICDCNYLEDQMIMSGIFDYDALSFMSVNWEGQILVFDAIEFEGEPRKMGSNILFVQMNSNKHLVTSLDGVDIRK